MHAVTIREGGGVEARRLKRVLVEPEADCVLWLHVSILLVLGHGERQWSPGRSVSAARGSGRIPLKSATLFY